MWIFMRVCRLWHGRSSASFEIEPLRRVRLQKPRHLVGGLLGRRFELSRARTTRYADFRADSEFVAEVARALGKRRKDRDAGQCRQPERTFRNRIGAPEQTDGQRAPPRR